jgi:phosphoglycerate dehydrogenase-like enzyme
MKILVITPVHHISGIVEALEKIGEVTYLDDPTPEEVCNLIPSFDAIFTNPNKSKVFIGKEVIEAAQNLKVICTASTGTNHIDKSYAEKMQIPILALTEEREVINKISSTAEQAFALTLAGLRHISAGHSAVLKGEWDYTKFIGRQMNTLTVGVIGYGRLGSIYANFCRAFGSRVLIYDPYKKIQNESYEQVSSLQDIFINSNVISIHVHVTDETINMINKDVLRFMKGDALLVNTARGDIVNEADLVKFLEANPESLVATDVLSDEIRNRLSSPLLQYANKSNQVTISPHVGGMTREAQEIAYGHAASMLGEFLLKTHTK